MQPNSSPRLRQKVNGTAQLCRLMHFWDEASLAGIAQPTEGLPGLTLKFFYKTRRNWQ